MHRVVFSINATCNAAFKLGQNKYVTFMEAHFHHKFEKGNCDFLSHNSDFFYVDFFSHNSRGGN